jgi:UDP-N-acetylglucosamine 2-epimerase
MNRQITGRLATLHFAPTPLSRDNLMREGVSQEQDKSNGEYGYRCPEFSS